MCMHVSTCVHECIGIRVCIYVRNTDNFSCLCLSFSTLLVVFVVAVILLVFFFPLEAGFLTEDGVQQSAELSRQ